LPANVRSEILEGVQSIYASHHKELSVKWIMLWLPRSVVAKSRFRLKEMPRIKNDGTKVQDKSN
jgi:hypothetical protein